MKELLTRAIRLRLYLIRTNRSRITGASQICKELAYWIGNGADCDRLAQMRDIEIRMILTKSHMKKYNELKIKQL